MSNIHRRPMNKSACIKAESNIVLPIVRNIPVRSSASRWRSSTQIRRRRRACIGGRGGRARLPRGQRARRCASQRRRGPGCGHRGARSGGCGTRDNRSPPRGTADADAPTAIPALPNLDNEGALPPGGPALHEGACVPLMLLKSASLPRLGGGPAEAMYTERSGDGMRVSRRRRSWTLRLGS